VLSRQLTDQGYARFEYKHKDKDKDKDKDKVEIGLCQQPIIKNNQPSNSLGSILFLAIRLPIEINCKKSSHERINRYWCMCLRFFGLSEYRTCAPREETKPYSASDMRHGHKGKIQCGPANHRLPKGFPDVGAGKNHRFKTVLDIPRWKRD
jgi:hypothetical protein